VYYLKSCAISSDGGTLAAGWYRTSFLQNRVQLFDPDSPTPLWSYLFATGGGEWQDVPSAMGLTSDGGYLVVGSWGDQLNTNPEVHVFARPLSNPILTVDTPGSVFDVDIIEAGGGGAYVTACGKHIHANESGRGGDLYSIRVDELIGVNASGVRRLEGPHLEALPSPYRLSNPIRFRLPQPATADVAIYSPSGERVRGLAGGPLAAGDHWVTWDGRTESGAEAASGVYLLRVQAGSQTATGRFVFLR